VGVIAGVGAAAAGEVTLPAASGVGVCTITGVGDGNPGIGVGEITITGVGDGAPGIGVGEMITAYGTVAVVSVGAQPRSRARARSTEAARMHLFISFLPLPG
jgi:hypothetical protein